MSDISQGGSTGSQAASASPQGAKHNALWVAVIAGVIIAGIAIYFLGNGSLDPLQRAAIFAASLLALLFAFFLGLWLAVGSPAWLQCDGLKSCVAWALAIGGGALVVFVLVWVLVKFTGADASSTVALPLLVIVGVIVLLIVVGLVTFIFSVLGLASPTEALGLPDGSVRSIIALMLLVLFSILSLFLYNSMATGKVDPAAADIAKQLVVLLGTLVTAVASFYFGTNAVSSAHADALKALGGKGGNSDKNLNGNGSDGSGDQAGRDKNGG